MPFEIKTCQPILLQINHNIGRTVTAEEVMQAFSASDCYKLGDSTDQFFAIYLGDFYTVPDGITIPYPLMSEGISVTIKNVNDDYSFDCAPLNEIPTSLIRQINLYYAP